MSTRKLNIGLDFDDTLMLTREALVRLLNARHNTTIHIHDCTTYYLSQLWNLTDEQFTAFFNEHEHEIHTQPPVDGLLDTLAAWAPFANFYVVTGRPEIWKSSARRWLENHAIPVTDLICANGNGEKAIVARKYNLELFIDDHATFAREIADAGIPVLLLDRPYNRHLSHKNVTRVKDWHHIREHVSAKLTGAKPQLHDLRT